jgi:hypothetical protein
MQLKRRDEKFKKLGLMQEMVSYTKIKVEETT